MLQGGSAMHVLVLAFIGGLLCLRWVPVLPSQLWLLFFVVAALFLLKMRLFLLSFFLLGFSWACCSAQWALHDQLDLDLDGRTLWLEGIVVGLPQWSQDRKSVV